MSLTRMAAAMVQHTLSAAGACSRRLSDKLSEVPSERDFGAPADGVTDARGALIDASAAGDHVVPPGRYLISAPVSVIDGIVRLPMIAPHMSLGWRAVLAATHRRPTRTAPT